MPRPTLTAKKDSISSLELIDAISAFSPLGLAGLLSYGPRELGMRLAACWRILDPRKQLPIRKLEDIFSGAELAADIPNAYIKRGSASPYEKLCLALFARQKNPRKIIEIGTFDGATARLMAKNAPEAEIYTLDLPPDTQTPTAHVTSDDDYVVSQRDLGIAFCDTPESSRIHQLYGDSANFNYGRLGGNFDMAFIDGAHDYAYVRSDTENILKIMSPSG